MWNWFVVPVFHIAQLSIPYAIGFSLVVGMFSKSSTNNETKEKKTTALIIGQALAVVFLTPLLTLFFGWIVTLFL